MNLLFGEMLHKKRKKQGLTTKILANRCGVSRSYITLIENNRRLPGKRLLPKLAAALKLEAKIVLNWYLEDISYKVHKHILKN